jgi:hypothetical protein
MNVFVRDKQTGDFPAGILTGGRPEVAQSGISELLGPNLNRRVSLIKVQGQDEAATTVTVALFLQREANLDIGKDNETPPCKASVSFGVGGTSIDYDVDFIDGTLLTLPTSNLTVTAELDLDDGEVPAQVVRVGAFISYLPRGGHARGVQRTLRAVVENAASVVFPIPRFAYSVTLLGSATPQGFTLEQYRDAAATVLVAKTLIPTTPPFYEVPLSNETRYVKITNTSGAQQRCSAIFQLFG